MDPDAVLADSAVELAPDDYAVITTERAVSGAFATVDDGRELTHVVREERVDELATLEAEPGWALLTFDATLPFELVGFLARVTSALAEEDVAVFALSAYSTDHVLVRRTDVESALAALSDLGCEVRRP